MLFSLFIPAVWVVYYCSGCLFRPSYRCHSAAVAAFGGSVIFVIIVRLEYSVLYTANIDDSSGLYRGLPAAYRVALLPSLRSPRPPLAPSSYSSSRSTTPSGVVPRVVGP